MKKLIIKSVIFFSLLCVLIVFLADPLFNQLEKSTFKKTMNQFYDSKKDSIDLLIFGSSHAKNTFNTTLIDKSLQTLTYNLGSASQKLKTTEYLIYEAINKSEPNVVILDVFYFSFQEARSKKDIDFQLKVYNQTKFSYKKWHNLLNNFSLNQCIYVISPTIRNHKKWYKLIIDDENGRKYETFRGYVPLKGFMSKKEREKYKDFYIKKYPMNTDEISQVITKNQKESLLRIRKFLESKKIKLILTTTPFLEVLYNKKNQFFQKDIRNIADSLNLDFLDFNLLYNQLGIDFTDFKEQGHLNQIGADKISAYLINYLDKKNYFEIQNNQHILNILNDIKPRTEKDNLELLTQRSKNTIDILLENGISNNIEHNFYKKLKTNNIIFSNNGFEKSILFEIKDSLEWKNFLTNKSLGIHAHFYKKDFNKRPKHIIKANRNLITWKVSPDLISFKNKNYVKFTLKEKTEVSSFKKIRLFFMDEEGYKGVIGNALEIQDIEFSKE